MIQKVDRNILNASIIGGIKKFQKWPYGPDYQKALLYTFRVNKKSDVRFYFEFHISTVELKIKIVMKVKNNNDSEN